MGWDEWGKQGEIGGNGAVGWEPGNGNESLKPSTDERGSTAELCVYSPHFVRHRRKFV